MSGALRDIAANSCRETNRRRRRSGISSALTFTECHHASYDDTRSASPIERYEAPPGQPLESLDGAPMNAVGDVAPGEMEPYTVA